MLVSVGRFKVAIDVIDRDGERVLPFGAKTTAFESNPIMLYNHNSWATPIGLWKDKQIENGALTYEALVSDATDKSKEILALCQDEVIKTCSIGFIPLAWSDKEDDKLAGQKGLTITEYELVEISLCNIPANQEATKSYKSEGNVIYSSAKDFIDNGRNGIVIKSFNIEKNFEMNIFNVLKSVFGLKTNENSTEEDVIADLKMAIKSVDGSEKVSNLLSKFQSDLEGNTIKNLQDSITTLTEKSEAIEKENVAIKAQLEAIKLNGTNDPEPDGDDQEERKPVTKSTGIIDLRKSFEDA